MPHVEWEETLTGHGSYRVNTQGAGEIPINPQHPHISLYVGKHTCNPSTVEQIQISQLRRGISGSGEIVSQTVRFEEDTWHHSVSTRVSAHMHRHTHAHMYTHDTHIHICTCINTHTHIEMHKYTQLYTHTLMWVNIQNI